MRDVATASTQSGCSHGCAELCVPCKMFILVGLRNYRNAFVVVPARARWTHPQPRPFPAALAARYHKPRSARQNGYCEESNGFASLCTRKHICISFLPDYSKISQTMIDRGMNKCFSCYLNDIKVFEPAENSTVTVQVAARCYRSEILQQGDSQVSEPCHDKPVNGVAQRAGGWRTGTPLLRSACNCNFL